MGSSLHLSQKQLRLQHEARQLQGSLLALVLHQRVLPGGGSGRGVGCHACHDGVCSSVALARNVTAGGCRSEPLRPPAQRCDWQPTARVAWAEQQQQHCGCLPGALPFVRQWWAL